MDGSHSVNWEDIAPQYYYAMLPEFGQLKKKDSNEYLCKTVHRELFHQVLVLIIIITTFLFSEVLYNDV